MSGHIRKYFERSSECWGLVDAKEALKPERGAKETSLLTGQHACYTCELEMSPTFAPAGTFGSAPSHGRSTASSLRELSQHRITSSGDGGPSRSSGSSSHVDLELAEQLLQLGDITHRGSGASRRCTAESLKGEARRSITCIQMMSKECMAISVGGGAADVEDHFTGRISEHIQLLDSRTGELGPIKPWYKQRCRMTCWWCCHACCKR